MGVRIQLTHWAVLFLFMTWPVLLLGNGGRIEINQASVEAAGGFPFTISQPGSYVLTGSLTVPPDATGLILAADHIRLDLNGFSIAGPFTCSEGACNAGLAHGIENSGQVFFNTIQNGQVYGFSGDCVSLYQKSRIERLIVHDCGQGGIQTSSDSMVLYSQVFSVGDSGIFLAGSSSVAAHNAVYDVSLGPGSHQAMRGARQTAGNYCDDDSCGEPWRRRFYLTQDAFSGSMALTACSVGFHMASMWELWNPAQLRYDGNLGVTVGDSGSGPPSGNGGWVRTGVFPFSSERWRGKLRGLDQRRPRAERLCGLIDLELGGESRKPDCPLAEHRPQVRYSSGRLVR